MQVCFQFCRLIYCNAHFSVFSSSVHSLGEVVACNVWTCFYIFSLFNESMSCFHCYWRSESLAKRRSCLRLICLIGNSSNWLTNFFLMLSQRTELPGHPIWNIIFFFFPMHCNVYSCYTWHKINADVIWRLFINLLLLDEIYLLLYFTDNKSKTPASGGIGTMLTQV